MGLLHYHPADFISINKYRFFTPARPIWPPWREGEGPTVAVEQGEDDVAHVVGQLDFGYGAGHLLHGGCGGVRETG